MLNMMDYEFKIKTQKDRTKVIDCSSLKVARGIYEYIYKTCRKEGLVSLT